MPPKQSKGTIIRCEPVSDEWAVTTRAGSNVGTDPQKRFRKRFCKTCPWLKANVGRFPPRAFELSARTSYDIADSMKQGSPAFQCHSDPDRICAGYIKSLNGHHSLPVRMLAMEVPDIHDQIADPPSEPFDNYYDMAVANGVDPESPAIAKVRRS